MNKIKIARDAILDDLAKRRKNGDKSVLLFDPRTSHHWFDPQKQKNCFSGAGNIDCPVCKQGVLQYSRSGYNGHVHGICTTDGCVAWME